MKRPIRFSYMDLKRQQLLRHERSCNGPVSLRGLGEARHDSKKL